MTTVTLTVRDRAGESAVRTAEVTFAPSSDRLTTTERDAAYADLKQRQAAWLTARAENPATAGPPPLWIPTRQNTGLVDLDEFAPYQSGVWTELQPSADGWVHLKPGTPYGNIRCWGPIELDGHDVEARNIVMCGPDPLTATAGRNIVVKNFGSDPKRHKFTDSLVDPHLWYTVRGRTRDPAKPTALHGLHGGNGTWTRVEVRHTEDGLQGVGRSSGDPNLQQNVWTCVWVHANEYRAAVPGLMDDSRTHSDGIQIVYGRNWQFNDCTIGGERDTTGYLIWEGAYNSGDDPQLMAVLIQQHSGTIPENVWVGNIRFSFCRFRGGLSTVTLAHDPNRPNDLATVAFEHCTALRRRPGWGESLTGAVKGDYTAGYVRVSSNGGLGHYALVNDAIKATGFRDILIEEADGTVTNQRIPISRG